MSVNLLTLKTIRKISLVPKGAAVGARVAFQKRKDDAMSNLDTATIAAIAKAVADAMKPDAKPAPAELIAKALDGVDVEKRKAIKSALAIEVAIVKEGMAGMAPAALLEAALADLPDDKKAAIMAAVAAIHQATPPPPANPAASPAVVEEEKADPKPEPEAEKQEPKPPAAGADEEEDMEKVLKGLTPEAAAFVKAMSESVEKLTKSLDEAVEKIAANDAETELAEQVEIVKGFKLMPGDVTKTAAALLALKKSDKAAHAHMVQQLGSADKLIAKGNAFAETGTARAAHILDGDSAHAQLDALAKARAAEKDEPYAVAFKKVCKASKENRELYAKAKTEAQ